MQFGNWLISEENISYQGQNSPGFVVPVKDLNALTEASGGMPPLYRWVLQATDAEWLSHDDLYDFNYAFVYAVAKFGLSFDYAVFDDTLAEQYDRFEEDEEEEEE